MASSRTASPPKTTKAQQARRAPSQRRPGTAERLVALHGAQVRHAGPLGWHAWDARRWSADWDGEVQRRAKLTVRAMYAEAARIGDDADRQGFLKFARGSESAGRLQAMVGL